MQYVKLAARLEELGRPIPTLGLRKIESYERRVDADDLVALAVALGVSPVSLLVPLDSDTKETPVAATGVSETTAERLWKWMRADEPINGASDGLALFEFITSATPIWRALQVAEGIKQLAELDRIERDMKSDDEHVAASARRRLDELRHEYGDD